MTNIDYIDLLEKPLEKQTDGITHFKNVVYYIIQIGTGATGSEVVRQLSQMLTTSNSKHIYIVADPDVISEKNIRNQIFLEEEINEMKAEVLTERYSAAYPTLNIYSFTDGYIETLEDIQKLLNPSFLSDANLTFNPSEEYIMPIIISCVDNTYSRRILSDAFKSLPQVIYLDAGNESVVVPNDWLERPNRSEWTKDEIDAYNNSGWTGQVICGVKYQRFYQPCFIDSLIIPENEDNIRPSTLSCQELAASDPQRTIVNRFSAIALVSYMAEIIEEHKISAHKTSFHAKDKYMRSEPYINLDIL